MSHPLRASRAPCKGAALSARQSRISGTRSVMPQVRAMRLPHAGLENCNAV